MGNLKNYIKRLSMNFANNKMKFSKMNGPLVDVGQHPLTEKSPPAPGMCVFLFASSIGHVS